jgi:hypothetical protein
MMKPILRTVDRLLETLESSCQKGRDCLGWVEVFLLLDSGRARVVMNREPCPPTTSSSEPAQPEQAGPVRPEEHPHFSVEWPGGDPSKGGKFDGQ